MTPDNTFVDELTGLLNSASFSKELKLALYKAKEQHQPLSIGMIDLDHFLKINEVYGHVGGDAVLLAVANVIRETIGEGALGFRYGGDEFMLLFPDTTREQTLLTMERMRAAIEQLEQFGQGKDAFSEQITLTGGIASYPVDGDAEDELMRKVDQALYRAKVDGRNKILLAYDERMIPKTTHYTETQLERLSALAQELEVTEARLMREALDDLIAKYRLTQMYS